jgi:hypothetical protein
MTPFEVLLFGALCHVFGVVACCSESSTVAIKVRELARFEVEAPDDEAEIRQRLDAASRLAVCSPAEHRSTHRLKALRMGCGHQLLRFGATWGSTARRRSVAGPSRLSSGSRLPCDAPCFAA